MTVRPCLFCRAENRTQVAHAVVFDDTEWGALGLRTACGSRAPLAVACDFHLRCLIRSSGIRCALEFQMITGPWPFSWYLLVELPC